MTSNVTTIVTSLLFAIVLMGWAMCCRPFGVLALTVKVMRMRSWRFLSWMRPVCDG